jgi:hypothetical protein
LERKRKAELFVQIRRNMNTGPERSGQQRNEGECIDGGEAGAGERPASGKETARAGAAAAGSGEGVHRRHSGGGPTGAAETAAHSPPHLCASGGSGRKLRYRNRQCDGYVCWKKQELGAGWKEIYIAQTYAFGEAGQVDWYQARVNFAGDEQQVYIFCVRSMGSGVGFHYAYLQQTQQAFLVACRSVTFTTGVTSL